MKIVVATTKSWNIKFAEQLKKIYEVKIITSPEELTLDALRFFGPKYIFFPHWSWIIPPEIYESFECVVFHMTDLPFGRGGSPLQNLIVRKIYDTKLSAIRVTQELDAGPIYCKYDLSLHDGTAQQILIQASHLIFKKMIPEIVAQKPVPKAQRGAATIFKRRSPTDGELLESMDLQTIFDYIRMLDGEGYPPSYLTFGPYRLEFSHAKFHGNTLDANVRFTLRNQEDT